jgi:hypothetical protein
MEEQGLSARRRGRMDNEIDKCRGRAGDRGKAAPFIVVVDTRNVQLADRGGFSRGRRQ